MPLSEHEQHLLEQMEQALYAEDPKFASQMQGSTARSRLRRKILIGVLTAVVGLALVVLGVINELVWLGGAGFGLMVAGAAYALTPPRAAKARLGTVAADGSVQHHTPENKSQHKSQNKSQAKPRAPKSRPAKSGTFMQRLEERWDRRRHDWR